MRIENKSNYQYVNVVEDSSGRRNSHSDKVAADPLVNDGISMEISERGVHWLEKWNRFWILMKQLAPY